MVRARPEKEVEIELLLDPSVSDPRSADVLLGNAGPAKRPRILVAVVVVAALAAAASRSTGGGSGSASFLPSTTIAGPGSSSVAADTIPIRDVAGATIPMVSSPPSKVGPMLPFGIPTGVGLYLSDDGPTTISLYDVDRGEVRTIALGDLGWFHRAIDGAGGVVIDGGRVVRVQPAAISDLTVDPGNGHLDSPAGRVAAGLSGGVWVRDSVAQQLTLLAESGEMGTQYDLPAGADLIGSMADGRPVVRGADQRSYVIETSGTRSLLSSGLTSLVDHGRFTETTCDDQQHCARVGHLDGQKRGIALPPDASVRFQPDGPWMALVAPDESLTLLNGQTGTEVKVRMTDHVAYERPVSPAMNDGPNVGFLPAGRGVVAITSTGVAFIDMNGEVVGTAPNLRPGTTMLGLGTALTNPTR